MGFLYVLLMGFLLGVKHSLEPDHVVAISTLASENKSFKKAALAGAYWGIGHTTTIALIGMIIALLKVEIPEVLSMSFEFLVGVMITYLGISSIFLHVRKRVHPRSYRKSATIGMIHGLAGSAAMIILIMSTVDTPLQALLYVLFFGVGTVFGMMLFTLLIGSPFVLASQKEKFYQLNALVYVTGIFSSIFGLHYMYKLGIKEGLFRLWF